MKLDTALRLTMLKCLLAIASLVFSSAFAENHVHPKQEWLTLRGQEPIVIARGGFSGVFPESSSIANEVALAQGLYETVLYCNVQLTKDGKPICITDIRLQNSTNIDSIFPKARKSYKVNGKLIRGWFSVDYMAEDLLERVNLVQSVMSRPTLFDGILPISTIEDILALKPAQVWLNAEYETFYQEHNLSITSFLQKAVPMMRISFVSSSEIGILKGLSGNVNNARTKLIFRFLEAIETEPTTGKTYGELAKDLPMIKSFASGILIRKEYIWPVGPDGYVRPATTLVTDAHKLGLEVYASGFANDAIGGYNYSYDPVREYLQFIDNGQFAVDGVLSDFTSAASQAIACYVSFRNTGKAQPDAVLVISSNGASGDYPGSTDLAYQAAIDDGAHIIDCSVQLSKDGVPFCMDTADLLPVTTVITAFSDKTTTIPEIQRDPGIFSFDLTWPQILTIKPQIINPFMASSGLFRNPAFKNKGKFMTLPEFLELGKAKAVSGMMIQIQNAAYLASKKGLDIVGIVSTALSNASLEQQSTPNVYIRSDDTSVLSIFKTKFPTFIRVLTIDGKFGNFPKNAVAEIKNYAQAVAIPRSSLVLATKFFTTGETGVVEELKASNISVFVYLMRNEYVSLAFDYFSQASLEIGTLADYFHVDGLITEFPYTAIRYLTSPCRPISSISSEGYVILPPEIGSLRSMLPESNRPPIDPPMPPLGPANIIDPPLPPVTNVSTTTSPAAVGPAAATTPSAAVSNVANLLLSLLSFVFVLAFLSHSAL